MAKLTRAQLERDNEILTIELGNALHRISVLELEKAECGMEIERLRNVREMDEEFVRHIVSDLDPSEDDE